jgi:hypothetical protein
MVLDMRSVSGVVEGDERNVFCREVREVGWTVFRVAYGAFACLGQRYRVFLLLTLLHLSVKSSKKPEPPPA